MSLASEYKRQFARRELEQLAPELQRKIDELLRELGRDRDEDEERDERPRPNRKAPRRDREGESF